MMSPEINITRSRPRAGYTALSNRAANDKNLSIRALGLLYYILTKPPTWRVIPDQLASRFDLSYRVVLKILNELRDAGYVRRSIIYENHRITGIRYQVSDDPEQLVEPDVGGADAKKQDDQETDFSACSKSSQLERGHPVISNDRYIQNTTFSVERGSRPNSLARRRSHPLGPSRLDRGRFELQIAARLCPESPNAGYEILMELPESEIEQLCTMQRRGTLAETEIFRIQARVVRGRGRGVQKSTE
jgi:hypothetical protein